MMAHDDLPMLWTILHKTIRKEAVALEVIYNKEPLKSQILIFYFRSLLLKKELIKKWLWPIRWLNVQVLVLKHDTSTHKVSRYGCGGL